MPKINYSFIIKPRTFQDITQSYKLVKKEILICREERKLQVLAKTIVTEKQVKEKLVTFL